MNRRLAADLAVLLLVSAAPAAETEPLAVERTVKEMVAAKGVTIVHFWAPWCGNCLNEERNDGWSGFIEHNPEVKFVFIESWNDGKDSRDALAKHNIGPQPNLTLLVHPGPRRGDGHMKSFMGIPVDWLPTTWVFREGHLCYAFNYGEMRFAILQQLLDDTKADW